MTHRIPALEGTTVTDAKKWFVEVIAAIGGTGWHLDDGPHGIVARDGAPLFTMDEADAVETAVKRLRLASAEWSDPDFLYHMAGNSGFAAEALWPGLIIDAGVLPCIRSGYVSMEGREVPNLVFEDGPFFIVEFPEMEGPISEHGLYWLSEVSGARHTDTGFDLSDAVVDESSRVEFHDLGEVEDVAIDMINGNSP